MIDYKTDWHFFKAMARRRLSFDIWTLYAMNEKTRFSKAVRSFISYRHRYANEGKQAEIPT